MRKITSRHPLAWSLVVLLLFSAALFGGSYLLIFAPSFFIENGSFLQQLVAESVMALVGIFLALIFGYGYIWGQTEHFGRGIVCGMYLIVISVFSAVVSVVMFITDPVSLGYELGTPLEPVWKIAVFVIMTFLIGLTEETFFRGIISNLFWDKHATSVYGIRTAAIYSGLVFGLMHAINFISSGDSSAFGGVCVQITAALVSGIVFTAIYYRCRNIWVTIFIHGFLDFCGLIIPGLYGGSIADTVGAYTPITAITNSLPYLIVALILLRKSKAEQMLTEKGIVPESVPEETLKKDKSSFKRALVIIIVVWIALFVMSVVLNPDIQNAVNGIFDGSGFSLGEHVLDVTNSGEWSGDITFGSQYEFTVESSGDYRLEIDSRPEDTNAFVLVQINSSDGKTAFESNYGGICKIGMTVGLDAGDYVLNLVYNYSEVTTPEASYRTRVVIG